MSVCNDYVSVCNACLGEGQREDGVHVYKAASLFVSKWVGVGLGVVMGTGVICLW